MWILSHHSIIPVRPPTSNTPILFLEPSCWSMFVEDYSRAKDRETRMRVSEPLFFFLFEKFVADLLEHEPDALHFKHSSASAEGATA